MPREVRSIIFTRDEVLVSLRGYWLHCNDMPKGKLDKFAISSSDPIEIEVIHDAAHPTRDRRLLNEADIAAALLLAGMNQKIPMPRKSERQLKRFGDMIGLAVTIGLNPRSP
ncbi:MAG: hypothetical protein EXQ87_11375 [Alphaproteobacteria bacterium]|nr:hypothetical protein [Alphaproteobacteria bacterium]